MKHIINEKQYRRELDRLDFTIDNRYFCETYLMDSDNYCLRIYDKTKNDEEIYSNWFNSNIEWVDGNEECYTMDEIQPVIDEAYNIISQYIEPKYI